MNLEQISGRLLLQAPPRPRNCIEGRWGSRGLGMRGEEESGLERNGKDWNRRVEELGRTESCGEELEGSGMEWAAQN